MKKQPGDRRSQRTRAALLGAFNHLVLSNRNKKAIKVADIVGHANVGRSTFYEHYSSADDIHMEALSHPFAILADAMAGSGDVEKLQWLLEHFWENRQRARATLEGQARIQAARLLASMLEERLASRGEPQAPLRLIVMQLSEGALALIRGWISGEAPCAAETLASTIIAISERSLDAAYAAKR